ncbi:MAG: RraA family protein [Lachnospiraceae bacterium]|jgi:regulator of RNase E activity RraA|nr:RraA family protein [Lachnospiraceae bacterium]
MTNQELIKEIRKLRCADLSDGMDAIGLVDKGTMNEQMRPIRPGIEFKGFAYTVKLFPKTEPVKACKTLDEWREELGKGCNDIYHFVDEITTENAKDMVIVVDMDGVRGGLWGSEIAMNMMIRGVEGVVLDGGCRDSHETNLEKAAVFCTKRTFTHVYGRVERGVLNTTVNCAGVTVKPGDVICADDDGVLVIPRERAEEVLMFARMQLEDDIATRSSHYGKLGYAHDETLDRLK